MRARFVWVLPAAMLGLMACKPKPPKVPDDEPKATGASGYGDAAYSTGIAPIQVCEHLAAMVAAEAGIPDPQIDPSMMAECERELSIEAATRGTSNWNEVAGCVLEAQTEADINYCDRTYPLPGSGSAASPAPSGDDSRERRVCEHMFEIVMIEATAELGEAPQITASERRQLSDECVATLVQEERPNRDAASYDQLLSCIGAANSGAEMERC
ncbi:hypothetical protein ENSA5_43030 [Enhygromyxa salina]|uniref:Lipoprotein n=1 Tax=Enhygromyxa salina TaxID=215803 RepID=A0A2S9XKJ6_9BACT|nr:hypothetical protein [Enhygromyxa salina]PRP93404.1 hypothetical protein ENSA5_43030 [Enhygromyxa salina]